MEKDKKAMKEKLSKEEEERQRQEEEMKRKLREQQEQSENEIINLYKVIKVCSLCKRTDKIEFRILIFHRDRSKTKKVWYQKSAKNKEF